MGPRVELREWVWSVGVPLCFEMVGGLGNFWEEFTRAPQVSRGVVYFHYTE